MTAFRNFPRVFVTAFYAVVLCFVFSGNCSAQIKVDLSFKRKLYVLYEPLVAVVSIENLSGRPLPSTRMCSLVEKPPRLRPNCSLLAGS